MLRLLKPFTTHNLFHVMCLGYLYLICCIGFRLLSAPLLEVDSSQAESLMWSTIYTHELQNSCLLASVLLLTVGLSERLALICSAAFWLLALLFTFQTLPIIVGVIWVALTSLNALMQRLSSLRPLATEPLFHHLTWRRLHLHYASENVP